MTEPPVVIVVAPIEPSLTGNGLAMRVATLVEATAMDHRVHLVVVAAAGRPPVVVPPPGVSRRLDVAPLTTGDHGALGPWLSDPIWRDRLATVAPLPDLVARTPLATADEAISWLGSTPVVGVLACRGTTSLVGLRLAEHFGVNLVVDLDDDDATLVAQQGDPRQAEAWRRTTHMALAGCTLALAASEAVAASVAHRNRGAVPIAVVPNCAPPGPARPGPAPGHKRLLFVGNLTYRPNLDGARWLVEQVLPLLPEPWTIDLAGPHHPGAFADIDPRVTVHGVVADLESLYAACDVVGCAVLVGSGTRIKVLEAMAHHRPVVATTAAVDGLAIQPGHHALVADEPSDFAGAIERAAEPAFGVAMARQAHRLVESTYDRSSVISRAGRLLAEAFGPEEHDH